MVSRRQAIKGILFGTAAVSLSPTYALSETLPDYHISVNIPSYSMVIRNDGRRVGEYEIGVGKPSTRTPQGEYRIRKWAPWENQFGYTWMRFKENPDKNGEELGGWGIHGSPCEELVGHCLSKGCIKLKPAEARELREGLFSSKNRVKGATLDIGYDILEKAGVEVTIWSDIYSQMGDIRGALISRFDAILTEKNVNNERLREILEYHKKKTENYVRAVKSFYRNFIEPLPENTANPNVVKENGDTRFWLDIMNDNRNVKFRITDIML